MAKTDDADSREATPSNDADSRQATSSRYVSTPNRVPAVVIGSLIVVFVVGALLATVGKKKSPPGDVGVRAVVVPTTDSSRTVVVPPCGTGERITVRNVAAQATTPGATVVQLPESERPRVLLVPRCSASASRAGAKTVAPVPSSVFVLTAGAKTAVETTGSTGKGTLEPRSELIVPTGSEGKVVVVPPCTGSGRAERATVLAPRAGSQTALIAPAC